MEQKKQSRRWGSELFELLGSMRFAISLLMIVCVASAIGTILQQNQTEITYVDMFGTYWYQVFSKFDVAQIYNTWWFLVIMAFLVISTSICLIRNVPKMVKDMRSFRDYVRITSLRAFPHKIDVHTDYPQQQSVDMAKVWLKRHGYAFREKIDGDTVLLASKKGSSNRLGYIFAHLAIVVVCIGGLLDSELLNRMQTWTGAKKPIPMDARFMSDVPDSSRFAPDNPSFRGNILVSEGDSAQHAMLLLGGDSFLQALPFTVKLNKFIVEYYELNGMPKRFASDVTITDHETGKVEDKIIEVNHPYSIHGVMLYQSSFDDGGSKVDLIAHPVQGASTATFEVKTQVNQPVALPPLTVRGREEQYQLTVNELRPINVEDLSSPEDLSAPKDFEKQILAVTGSAAAKNNEKVRNVGPLVSYTLTDSRNQSIEYRNYMLPMLLDERLVFLVGIRLPGQDGFSYVRMPADETGKLDEFLALRAAFNDPIKRKAAAQAYADKVQDSRIDKANAIVLAERALEIFAHSGFKGIDDHVDGVNAPTEQRVPENLREPMKQILRDYLVFSAIELRGMVRQELGMPALDFSQGTPAQMEQQARWFDSALRALSDLPHYQAPLMFQMRSYEHVQASVLQATRSPGKYIVYLGSLLLILGVFAMFYIRERRIWLWVNPDGEQGSQIRAAMTSQKRTMDFKNEYEQFKQDFAELERK